MADAAAAPGAAAGADDGIADGEAAADGLSFEGGEEEAPVEDVAQDVDWVVSSLWARTRASREVLRWMEKKWALKVWYLGPSIACKTTNDFATCGTPVGARTFFFGGSTCDFEPESERPVMVSAFACVWHFWWGYYYHPTFRVSTYHHFEHWKIESDSGIIWFRV